MSVKERAVVVIDVKVVVVKVGTEKRKSQCRSSPALPIYDFTSLESQVFPSMTTCPRQPKTLASNSTTGFVCEYRHQASLLGHC